VEICRREDVSVTPNKNGFFDKSYVDVKSFFWAGWGTNIDDFSAPKEWK
jgi:hypothetical protein